VTACCGEVDRGFRTARAAYSHSAEARDALRDEDGAICGAGKRQSDLVYRWQKNGTPVPMEAMFPERQPIL